MQAHVLQEEARNQQDPRVSEKVAERRRRREGPCQRHGELGASGTATRAWGTRKPHTWMSRPTPDGCGSSVQGTGRGYGESEGLEAKMEGSSEDDLERHLIWLPHFLLPPFAGLQGW